MTDYIRSPVFQIKCAQLLLTLVAILSFLGATEPSAIVFLNQLVDFSLYGWLLLDLLIIAGFFIREPISKFLILVASLSGSLFCFVAAVVLFVGWSHQASGRLLVTAINTIVNTPYTIMILVVSLSGTLFCFVAAVVLFVGWSQQASGRLLVAAISTLVNTLCYAGDSFYIIRFAAD